MADIDGADNDAGVTEDTSEQTSSPEEWGSPGTGSANSTTEFVPAADESASAESDELAERTADLQRLTAEYANYRRRVERDRISVIENAKASVVSELLGVLDDLDRARTHGDLETGPLKSVADKLSDALTKQGLSAFGTDGEVFDPTLHEAVQHEGEGHNPIVGAVLRKGYRFGDRVLRHALVAVADGVTEKPDNRSQPDNFTGDVDAAGSASGIDSTAGSDWE